MQVELKKHLALYMFKERRLSFGKAAELFGVNKIDFMELAGSKKYRLTMMMLTIMKIWRL